MIWLEIYNPKQINQEDTAEVIAASIARGEYQRIILEGPGERAVDPKYTTDEVLLWISDIEFNFNFTKTVALSPNTGSVTINGLGRDNLELLHAVCDPYSGDEQQKALMSWENVGGEVITEDTGTGSKSSIKGGVYRFVRKYKKPLLAGSPGKTEIKEQAFKYREIGWAKCKIYKDETLLYCGDVVAANDELEGITLQLGTGYNFFNMPYSQRVSIYTAKYDLVTSRNVSQFFLDPYDTTKIQEYSVEAYINIAVRIIEEIQKIDPFRNYSISPAEFSLYTKEISGVLRKAFQELSRTGDLNIGQAVLAPKKKGDGKDAVTGSYIILSGTIQSVLEQLTSKALFTLHLNDDEFVLWNYFVTLNPRETIFLSDAVLDTTPKDMLIASNFLIQNGRAVFNTGDLDLMLRPGYGVVILDEAKYKDETELSDASPPDRRDDYEDLDSTDMYIDTVECSGDVYSQVVTYSGKIFDFMWRDDTGSISGVVHPVKGELR